MALYEVNTLDGAVDFECRDETARVLQNVKNLLMARRGECCFDRQRGLDPFLFHLPDAEMRRRLMPEIDRALLWEPSAEAMSARIVPDGGGDGVLYVTVNITGE